MNDISIKGKIVVGLMLVTMIVYTGASAFAVPINIGKTDVGNVVAPGIDNGLIYSTLYDPCTFNVEINDKLDILVRDRIISPLQANIVEIALNPISSLYGTEEFYGINVGIDAKVDFLFNDRVISLAQAAAIKAVLEPLCTIYISVGQNTNIGQKPNEDPKPNVGPKVNINQNNNINRNVNGGTPTKANAPIKNGSVPNMPITKMGIGSSFK